MQCPQPLVALLFAHCAVNGLRQPVLHLLADDFVQLIGQDVGGVGPLGFPHRLPHLVLDANYVLHRLIATAECLDDHLFADLVRPGLHHQQCLGGAGQPQVERAVLHLRDSGIDDHFSVNISHAHGSHRPVERDVGDGQCRRRADDGQNVGLVLFVL